ncbi:MAG TPA: hypothetical protein VKR06_41960 [Ktedonosporobacter sp.]|nr:hypothetical protein [Ktedonosporobacter sp.]
MDVIQTSIERSPSGFHLRCKLCNNLLPLSATFCGTCGGRVTNGSADPSEHDRAPEEHVEQTDGGEMTVALHPRKVRQALEQQAKLITRPLAAVEVEANESIDEVPTITIPSNTPHPEAIIQDETENSASLAPIPTTPTLDPEVVSARDDLEPSGDPLERPLEPSLVQRFKQTLTHRLQSQVLPHLEPVQDMVQSRVLSPLQSAQDMLQTRVLPRLLPMQARVSQKLVALSVQSAEEATTLFKRVQRFVIGEQQPLTRAAALIEAPLRVQPGQDYVIRLRLIGRSVPKKALGGLSGLRQDEVVHIEVRSTLFTHYAYVLQQADVRLPAQGYAAEITMPMPPFLKGTSGRRERLHIFFMDERRHPLYEKPFAIELFVSPLVRAGSEGYHTLTIPL